jgi:heme-degrading monooxygenase HmoA
MHARVVTTQLQPGKTDEAIRVYRDSVVPAARKQKGFKGGLLLTDRATGKGISIALWETEADMKATETSGYLQEQIAKFGALFAAPPVRETFEVTVQESA